MNIDEELFPYFKKVSRLLLETKDVDPWYWLLKEVYKRRDYSEEEALWYSFCFVNWYWMASVEEVVDMYPRPQRVDVRGLKKKKERRCVRGGEKAAEHINWIQGKKPLKDWVDKLTRPGGQQGWRNVRDAYEKAPYCGGWAGYKLCDLLKYAHGYSIEADDLGTGSGNDRRGPIKGIIRLTDFKDMRDVTGDTAKQRRFYQVCKKRGIPFDGLEQMETCLCNFNGLIDGNYYIGQDIDVLMQQIKGQDKVFWEVRKELFPRHLLGEYRGWFGKQKNRQQLFRENGVIEWWKY